MSGSEAGPHGVAAQAPPTAPDGAAAPTMPPTAAPEAAAPEAAPPAAPGLSTGADAPDGAHLRVSDAERHAVVVQLSRAAGDGLITLDELSDTAAEAYAAVTRGDLEAVGAGLALPMTPAAAARAAALAPPPTHPTAGPAPTRLGATDRRWVVAVMSAARRQGRWQAGSRIGAFAFWGAAKVDLRGAVLEGTDVDIVACAVMGGVKVIVPEGIPVDLDGLVVMGGRTNRARIVDPVPGAPRVTVRAYGLWGGVTVVSRKSKRASGKERGRGPDDDRDRRPGPPPLPVPPPLPAPPAATMPSGLRAHPHPRNRSARPDRSTPEEVSGGLVTIVCTDIVGSTRTAVALGDQRWREVLAFHNSLVRAEVERYSGTEVKTTGDGFLVTFTSARAALRCAVAVQDALRALQPRDEGTALEVRIGVHAGEVEHDGADVVGRNVNLACRLCDVAAPGEVLASGVVAELADSASDLAFAAPREHTLAGIDRPVVGRAVHAR